ncbi:Histidine phosphatase superfamily [Phytophthora cactorum]|nr:Histidine phosphatase superfamily [Phytophthora cactorum]
MSRCTEFVKLLAAVCLVFDAAGAERQVLRKHMSTKTLYAPHPWSESDILEDTCTPVQLNFAIRHGTRNPTTKDITRINDTHTRLLTARNGAWKNPYPKETEAWLADPGVRELVEIGHRLRARLSPSPVFYDASKFIFEHTWKIRTKQSAEAFAFGFFDGLRPVYYHSHPIGQDEVLRFYDNCPVFETQIDSNKSSTIEHSKYRNSEQMHKNLAKFQRRTGFAEATQKDMEAAYAGCAFDVAVQAVFDQWCSFFDDEMLLSMDYFQDLSTSTGKDIFRTMKERVDGKSEVEGLFRFAHAETILPLASLLNVSYFDDMQVIVKDTFAQTHRWASTAAEVQELRAGAISANIGLFSMSAQIRRRKAKQQRRSK